MTEKIPASESPTDMACINMGKRFIPKDECVLFDVGSNKGGYISLFRNTLPDRNVVVHGFEPNLDIFPDLNEQYKNDKNTYIVPEALSNESGSKALYYPPAHTSLGSFDKRPVFMHNKHNWGEPVVQHVTVTTVDEYVGKNDISKIDYLKIDTEGNELNVLKGSKNSLKTKKIVCGQFEYGGTFYDNGTKLSDAVLILEEYGYHVFDVINGFKISSDIGDNYQYNNYFFVDSDL